jgi:hypothetical protein
VSAARRRRAQGGAPPRGARLALDEGEHDLDADEREGQPERAPEHGAEWRCARFREGPGQDLRRDARRPQDEPSRQA